MNLEDYDAGGKCPISRPCLFEDGAFSRRSVSSRSEQGAAELRSFVIAVDPLKSRQCSSWDCCLNWSSPRNFALWSHVQAMGLQKL